ncbi:MAG: hypothetical protein ACTSU5_01655 [Promethearchaeota archaeon]
MESLLQGIEDLLDSVFFSDPAVLAARIVDTEGMELAHLVKERFPAKNDHMGPLVNAIMKYVDRFMKFLKRSPNDPQPFVFSWYFENIYVFAAHGDHGTIVIYADPDVSEGYVKVILERAVSEYNKIMQFVFQ